jgi:hypothetical protein
MKKSTGTALLCLLWSVSLLAACSGNTEQTSKATDTNADGYIRTDPNLLNSENTGTGGETPASDTNAQQTIFQSHSNTPSTNSK